jgi:hypothetical protein
MMRQIKIIILLIAVLGVTATSSAEDDFLPKWLDLLERGTSREKIAALNNLYYLRQRQYRYHERVWDPILKALKDKDPLVREAAASCLKDLGEDIQKSATKGTWSSGCCRQTKIVPSLVEALKDGNPRVRAQAALALGMYRFDRVGREMRDREYRAIDPLIKVMKDRDPWARFYAVYSLGLLGAVIETSQMTSLMKDNSDWRYEFSQRLASRALKTRPEGKSVSERKGTSSVQLSGRKSIGHRSSGQRDIEKLIEQLNSADCKLACGAVLALGKTGDKRAVEPLINALKSRRECDVPRSAHVRDRAVVALAYELKDSRAIPAMLEIVKDKDEDISFRSSVAFNIGVLGDPSVLDELKELMKGGKVGEADRVRAGLSSAIYRLSYIKENQ